MLAYLKVSTRIAHIQCRPVPLIELSRVVRPKIVPSTDANSLLPGIREGRPAEFDFSQPERFEQLASACDSVTVRDLGDAASGNISSMVQQGLQWQTHILPLSVNRSVLSYLNDCQS